MTKGSHCKVLVVGGGGREHSLAWKLSCDPTVQVLCAPGNAGSSEVAECFDVSASDVAGLVTLATEQLVDLVVVGPEAPLVAGLVDALEAEGIPAFGPSQAAAQLEGSKVYSKLFMQRHGIPTADFAVFEDAAEAEAYIREANRPLVVKADGLAAGKGVIVASDADEAIAGVHRIMRDRDFGEAGARLLVEELLPGQEVSFHVVCDGEGYVAMAPAQDHKRIGEGDVGPNTGGMGAYSPPPVVDAALQEEILKNVVEPTLRGMRSEGAPFRGVLFVGLMISDAKPMVLEYNVRFGDPECQTIMTRWSGPILPLLRGAAVGDLSGVEGAWEAPCSLCVVLASEGYPGAYPKGRTIHGLGEASAQEGVQVFHAGTRRAGQGYETSGGRVLAVAAIGESVEHAAERAYAAADHIEFEGMQLRRDIGHHARKSWS